MCKGEFVKFSSKRGVLILLSFAPRWQMNTPAPVVVLPADVPEAPPPAVAAAVVKEKPLDTAVIAPRAEVKFSPLICCLFN